jgi:hypothetical protein
MQAMLVQQNREMEALEHRSEHGGSLNPVQHKFTDLIHIFINENHQLFVLKLCQKASEKTTNNV